MEIVTQSTQITASVWHAECYLAVTQARIKGTTGRNRNISCSLQYNRLRIIRDNSTVDFRSEA